MVRKSTFLRDFDLLLFIATILIALVGVAIIFSAVGGWESSGRTFALKQTVWVALGILVMVAGFLTNPEWLISKGKPLYIGVISILVILLVLGRSGLTPARWFHVGLFSIQPSELAKIAYLLYATGLLAKKAPKTYPALAFHLFLAFCPALLIAAQPDLGTAFIFLPLLLLVLLWAGVEYRLLIILLAPLLFVFLSFTQWWITLSAFAVLVVALRLLGANPKQVASCAGACATFALVSPLLWRYILREYQRQRILTLFNPSIDPLGAGYNIIQSQIAIGSGGFWGKGFLAGTQTKLRFLPQQHTDFVFSVLAEEFGFVGVILTLAVFAFIILRGTRIARRAMSKETSILAMGIVGLISIHVIVNIAMSLGLFPVTGLPLPFLSYGGSNILVNFFSVGLLLGIEYRRHFF